MTTKPTWKPELSDEARANHDHFCRCCGWRTTINEFCNTCWEAAKEAPPQSPRPIPIKVSGTDKPAIRKRGWTSAEKAYIDSILPVTCKRCGAGDHVSGDCPRRHNTEVSR